MLKPIKITWLEECDSTSRLLKEKVFGGGQSSFEEFQVISAARQSQGVGRLGSQWQSVSGNLHYSIAIPAKMIAPEIRDILPLAMGAMCSSWIEQEFAVRPCLKWPNDILVDGKKIGGILCEGSIQGNEFAGVVVGIGLNLLTAPTLNEKGSYLTGSLSQTAGKNVSAKWATESLTEFFRNAWPKLSLTSVLDHWRRLAIGDGHLWMKQVDGLGSYFSSEGVNSQGHLQLSEFELGGDSVGRRIEVSTANHEYIWAPQICRTLLVADIGNTRTKVSRVNLDHLKINYSQPTLETISVPNGDLSFDSGLETIETKQFLLSLTQWISNSDMHVDPMVHAVSVNQHSFDAFQKTLKTLKISSRLIKRQPVRAVKSLYDLNQIGIDRLSLIEAIQYLHVRAMVSFPVMCVSLGTATTVDMLDGAGVHLGGYIAAGLGVALDAIASKGSQLPKSLSIESVDLKLQNRWPQNTEEAMTWAPLNSTLSFLKSEREKLAVHCGLDVEKVSVYLTGGHSAMVAKAWQEDQIYHIKDLVLLGAGILAVNGR